MSTPPPQQPDDAQSELHLLDQYLDGQLTGEEAARAEKLARENDQWRLAIAAQQRIDLSLNRQFGAPAPNAEFIDRLSAGVERLEPSELEVERPMVMPLRRSEPVRQYRMQWVAAALLLVSASMLISASWDQINGLFNPRNSYSMLPVASIYQNGVAGGFEPEWLCEDEQRFAQTFQTRQGQALLLDPLPEGVQIAGMAYWQGLTKDATCVLSYVEGQPVLIMVEVTRLVPKDLLESTAEVNIFTRQLSGLTIIEATPLAEPRVSELLRVAEVPAAPTGRAPGAV